MTLNMNHFAAWVLTNSLKASILILIILSIQFIFRNRLSAKWQYAFWFLLVIRLLIPNSLESQFSLYNLRTWFQPSAATTIQPINQVPLNPITTTVQMPIMMAEVGRDVTRQAFLSMLWGLGALIIAVIAIMGNYKLWRKVEYRTPIQNKNLNDIFDLCKRRMEVRTPVSLCQVEGIAMPMLYGLFKPTVLIPARQVNTLTEQQFKHVFCHELAHHKRKDILLAHITTLLQILHWFNPLMWIAFYKIRLDREIACDGMALDRLGRDQAKAYGHTIIAMLEQIVSDNLLPITVGVVESKRHLKKRLSMIARFKKRSVMWSVAAVVLLSVVGCAVLTEAKKKDEPPRHSMIIQMRFQEPGSKLTYNGQNIEVTTNKKGQKYCKADVLTIRNIPVESDLTKQIILSGEHIELTQVDSLRWKVEADRVKIDTVSTDQAMNDNSPSDNESIKIFPFNKREKWGYKNKTGKIVIQPQYQKANNFVSLTVDNNSLIKEPTPIAGVQINNKWGFINHKGDFVIPPQYDVVSNSFFEGMSRISTNDKWGFLDSSGNIIVQPQYEFISNFGEGLVAFRINGKTGYLNKKGEIVIKPIFDQSYIFVNGLALTQLDKKWGFIDKSGKWTIPPRYETANEFSENLAGVKIGNKFGFINKNNEIIIEPAYDMVLTRFKNGTCRVMNYGQEETQRPGVAYTIDTTGKVLDKEYYYWDKQKKTNPSSEFDVEESYNILLSNSNNGINKRHTIILDPGHGGKDPGAKISDEIQEKDINLNYAKMLQEYLSRAGFNVILTRSEDQFLDLKTRVNVVDENQGDMMVSIHFGYHTNTAKSGPSVYYAKDHTQSHELAMNISYNLYQLSNHDSVFVSDANFYILNNASCPAVLIEPGFLSNKEQLTNLLNPDFEKKIVLAIANGIITYFNPQIGKTES